jgi:hypothetical protein
MFKTSYLALSNAQNPPSSVQPSTAQEFSHNSRYWLVRSVTIACSGLSLRPKTFSAFEELERPGFDFFVWDPEIWPDLTA